MHPHFLKTLLKAFGFGLQLLFSVGLALLCLRVARFFSLYKVDFVTWFYIPLFHLSLHLPLLGKPKTHADRLVRVGLAMALGALSFFGSIYLKELYLAPDFDPVRILKGLLVARYLIVLLYLAGYCAALSGLPIMAWLYNPWPLLRPFASALVIVLGLLFIAPNQLTQFTALLASAPFGLVLGRWLQRKVLASSMARLELEDD